MDSVRPVRLCAAHLTGVTLLAVFTSACSTQSSPGSPQIRTSTDDGFGTLVENCLNVSPVTRPLRYQTDYYLSTWSSAWSEGTQSGLQSGLKAQENDRSRARFTKELSSTVIARTLGYDGNAPPFPPFCMSYRASAQRVNAALTTILPQLQNSVLRGQPTGVYKTDYFDREHMAARWKDRYVIHVNQVGSDSTEVAVYRDLWIARQNTSHVRAQSNGGNETWILQSLVRALNQ